MKTVAMRVAAYCIVAILAFGDVFRPISLMTFWSDRLGIPHWRMLVFTSAVVATTTFFLPPRTLSALSYKIPIFIALTMVASIFSVGYFAEVVRQEKLAQFRPDEYIDLSFFKSIHEAPREFQFYLHTAALKNCVPYGWSYRTMSFYNLPPNVAVNVVGKWAKRCGIHRS
ncbi:hypothetical protein [Sphingobium sp.]|uniref:hypothetical protein n=1 Tax=Sphingobium sp. TaxID=1912891 RepID=UPI002B6E4978|nr:hypothetical protein [Sphingobium sp.]HUD95366.1 hypothetical protein [Sphingobium sp.]